jgi:hypothetical protein
MDIGALVTHLGKLRSDFLGGDDLNIPELIFIPSCGKDSELCISSWLKARPPSLLRRRLRRQAARPNMWRK